MPISLGQYKENMKSKIESQPCLKIFDEPTTISNATKERDKASEKNAQEKDKKALNVNSHLPMTANKINNRESDVISNSIDNLCNKNIDSKNEQVIL